MESTIRFLSWVSTVALVAVAVSAVRDHRRSGRTGRALAWTFVMIATSSVAGRANQLSGYTLRPLSIVASLAFMASGYLLLEHRSAIVPLSRRARVVAIAALGGSTIGWIASRPPMVPGSDLALVHYLTGYAMILSWCAASIEPSVRFWRVSRDRPAVERAQLRLLSLGYAGIVVLLLFAVSAGQAVRDTRATVIGYQLFGLALIPMLYGSVSPPGWLRRRWLRRASARAAGGLFPVGSFYWDLLEDRIVWSPEQYRLFGLEPGRGEVGADAWIGAVHPDDRAHVMQASGEAFLARKPFSIDHRVLLPDGEVRWIHGRTEIVSEPMTGRTVALYGTTVDVTDRKLAEEALRSAYDREREAAERLRAVDAMKDAFMEAVSHELRTPLGVVLGMGHMLARPDQPMDPEQTKRIADRLVVNAERLERLLSDLLDLDRLRRGILEPKRTLTHLRPLVDRVIDALAIPDHHLTVDVDGIIAEVSPSYTERIVENLVVNASRHTPAGTRIWVGATRSGDGVLLEVADDGPGVPDHLKAAIFDPFERGGASSARGTGIGLALVSKFAELHGGRAWVDDRPGGGSSFKVLLPEPAELEIGTRVREPASAR